MDPLSVIASIAGIAQAGTALSKAIYNLVSATRNAPKEAYDIARDVGDLSLILSELRRVLRDGKKIIRRRLLRLVSYTMRRIQDVHDEIHDLIDASTGIAGLAWAFRRSKCRDLTQQIDSYKVSINMILITINSALQVKLNVKYTKLVAKSEKSSEQVTLNQKQQAAKEESDALRQQAENLVQISHHSICEMVAASGELSTKLDVDQDRDEDETERPISDDVDNLASQTGALQLHRPKHNSETAQWLYDVLFSTAMEGNQRQVTDDDDGDVIGHPATGMSNDAPDRDIAVFHPAGSRDLQLFVGKLPDSSNIVNKLLSQWTTLCEDENEVTTSDVPERDITDNESVIHLKDSVGRLYDFPWRLARTWALMMTTGLNEIGQ
ncbi:hypothetical protein PG993_013314 [Apiospora rasikravindrae]|uniref:Azaphilone pigments biosynthesis cluster protein L N-terminal domain-containing protein n=1 Tax=Apiospora rasikravindrae TaxID=990691 RepID=A0ABR1RXA7_9PEZI